MAPSNPFSEVFSRQPRLCCSPEWKWRLYGNISFQKPIVPVPWIKHPLSSKAWASLNSPQQLETFQGFMHFGKMSSLFNTFQWMKKIHPYIQAMSSFLCQRQLLILFTSVIIINKKLLFLRECQMRHKKTTAVAIAQLKKGGRKKERKKETLISLALKSLRHKTENLP